jgi:reactive intermediate/imine deaminase
MFFQLTDEEKPMSNPKLTKLCFLLCGALLGALVSAAAGDAKRPARRYINLPNRNINAPFSDGVLVNDTLYLSGKLGLDPSTGKPPADAEQEARLMLDSFKAVLKEAGLTMDDIVTVQVFCPDLSLYDTFNRTYRSYFGKDVPARAFIGSGPLLRGARFEMQAVAVKSK